MSDSNTPAPDTSPTIAPLSMDWAQDELVPFLQSVFPDQNRPAHAWMRDITYARHNLEGIPFYEDFPLTIERLRLTLLNSETLNAGELWKMMRITDQGSQMCIRIFVRHAVRHGPYQLFSLGRDPSPEFPRGNQPRNVRPTALQPPAPAVSQASALAASQAPVPSVSYAQLADEDAALRRQIGALDLGAEGRRGVGRGRATAVQTDRPPQPRGGYNGRPDRGHHFDQGARISPVVQQAPQQYTPDPFSGYNQPYGDRSYILGPYMPATPVGLYGMQQQYPQQQFGNPQSQSYGGWNGSQTQTYYSAQQPNSSQSGASSAYMIPSPQTTLVPQQVRGPNIQGQPTQHFRGASAGQQAQVLVHNQGPSAPRQQRAPASGTNTSALHPEARPFNPGSNTTDD